MNSQYLSLVFRNQKMVKGDLTMFFVEPLNCIFHVYPCNFKYIFLVQLLLIKQLLQLFLRIYIDVIFTYKYSISMIFYLLK